MFRKTAMGINKRQLSNMLLNLMVKIQLMGWIKISLSLNTDHYEQDDFTLASVCVHNNLHFKLRLLMDWPCLWLNDRLALHASTCKLSIKLL
jgi:hypothetical protein